ncbi:uncharacterized protein LOC129874467 isoform X1 [Solanum dulcamara]|uniref:uncharacterized protein LOC129874467 isoform X1 n=2 Tax=Solanum dulcamara TaxID=45834 RepID=UPI002485C300|nr:uncharacterized protein LOC129874467 isoform X1 [Solanum dulcamara]XP_055805727.1 uncharacterized protein LOC129874467 isoform X1 [Solanum dulcamara]XP_055805728.1 uncharacterized protein LOC129874467 isoform X1 [Solanum dulcamara]XP_055805729.1 uncharacterized protein LOC129874467 isoform X1 [Solanum dulcamara]
MENGGDSLVPKLAGWNLNDSNNPKNNDGLYQVLKAVEAAEATIKQQVDENNRLRTELQKKILEVEKYRSGELKGQTPHSVGQLDHLNEADGAHPSNLSLGSQLPELRNMDSIGRNLSSNMLLAKDPRQNDLDSTLQNQGESQSEYSKVNGTLRALPGGLTTTDNSGVSHFSSPSASFSPNRYQIEGEYDRQLNLSGQGLMPVDEVNSSMKKDLVLKIQEHEQEVVQMRKHLSEYSIKEAQIRNEKYVLEKRIAYMRMAFDQQQQDLVDAASKAISYRQDIIEENIRLTYALQAAQQERSTFVSSLLPLLAEYSLQPPVADAQSIVSNVKVLFRHLQEKLFVTEAKLKESQYQMAPWRSDMNLSNFAHSPPQSAGIKEGLELVPQQAYSSEKAPLSSDPRTTTDWDPLRNPQSSLNRDAERNLETDDVGRYSPLTSRNTTAQVIPAQLAVSHGYTHSKPKSEETSSKQVTFSDLISSNEMDDSDMERHQNDREPSVNWTNKSSPYTSQLDDPGSSYSPYLPPVLEEPSSSYSEAADEEALPAIEGLQISGEAYPGQGLQACGYSINGTTSCNFEWVRHLEDGSFNYIEGAKQPTYLVTADDVDTYLAIEVQPLDNRKRKGELVKVFANEHRKITCDPVMHSCIEKTLYSGHALYKVSLSTRYLDIWEPATFAIKRDGYSIKANGPGGVLVNEKFSQSTIVSIPYGSPTEFSIFDSRGLEHLLKAENDQGDISCSRDTIVLTMRLFIIRAGEKKKGRRRGLFFNK